VLQGVFSRNATTVRVDAISWTLLQRGWLSTDADSSHFPSRWSTTRHLQAAVRLISSELTVTA